MASREPEHHGLLRSVRSTAAPMAKTLLMKGGAYALLRRVRPSRSVAILRYHAVCESDAGYADPSICLDPSQFEEHVRYLARNYAVLSLPLVVHLFRSGRTLPGNCVVITFDDGYADNLEAARVLHRYGCSGTFYITAGCLSDGQPFWPAEIRTLVSRIPGPRCVLQTGEQTVELPLASGDDRAQAVRRLTRLFKSNRIPIRESLREQLRAAAGGATASSPMLTWDQVREMRRLGMVIGGHTLTHPNLPSAGLEDATAEIAGCKARLEQELDEPVTMFSYPNGGAEKYYTPELQKAVRDAGFHAAATSRNGFAGPGSDPYALERVQVEERIEDLVFALEVERVAFGPEEQ